jgi:pyruvate,water dikinase
MTTSALIRSFQNIHSGDVALVGVKGASLGEMSNAKIPVPPGFVITTTAFSRFLEETDLDVEVDSRLNALNVEDTKSVDETSRVLRALFFKSPIPTDIAETILKQYDALEAKAPLVAVRSSATAEDSTSASWAGELETNLNTTRKDLLEKVKECWSSLYTPRALVYACDRGFLKRFEGTSRLGSKNIVRAKSRTSKSRSTLVTCDVKVAVVIQEMVQSEVSGVAFTVHPVTKDRNQMIIEAVLGLGEALVSGQVTPDSYVVLKKQGTIVDIHVSTQELQIAGNGWAAVPNAQQKRQKLVSGLVLKLSDLCLHIEKHYRFPCDIEWAYAKGKFWITQSRPITTL